MAEIIPAIIAKNFSELKKKIKQIEPYFDWVQLDIMDGKFVPNKTWQNPDDLRKIKTHLKFEAHLMVENPQEAIKKWLKVAEKVIVHWESQGAENIRWTKRMGIALNPETSWQEIEKLINQVDRILLMAVNPGRSGQKFLNNVLLKIKSLRKAFPKVKIEVDGGINLKTGKKCLEAGANILVSGSYIFKKVDEMNFISICVFNKLKT